MPPTATDPRASAASAPPLAASYAFGLDLEAGFPLDGLPPGARPDARAEPTRLELSDPGELRRAGSESVTLADWADQEDAWQLDHHPELGYVLRTDVYGTFAISDDGRRVRCAPPAGEGRGWQHCLRGQVLPFAALLRGFETFHASAVALDGRALAFAGRSTAGKTSVAVNLLLRGAELVTDDVLALEPGDGRPLAHPGAAVVSLRHSEAAVLGGRARPLGSVLEDDGEATRLLAPRCQAPLPLAALYVLQRGEAPGAGANGVSIEPIDPPDPRLLLSASFNFVVRSPERLRNQLEVCSRLASEVPLFRLRSGPGFSAADVAEAVERHARTLEAAR